MPNSFAVGFERKFARTDLKSGANGFVLAAIDEGRRPAIDGHEGRRAMEIVLAMYQAAASGKPVKLPRQGDPKQVRDRRRVEAAQTS